MNETGTPTVAAGVPPDYFSATGQLWGNPIYDWDYMIKDNFPGGSTELPMRWKPILFASIIPGICCLLGDSIW